MKNVYGVMVKDTDGKEETTGKSWGKIILE
jgi:hypothetical protein